jgi:hypothetical protein
MRKSVRFGRRLAEMKNAPVAFTILLACGALSLPSNSVAQAESTERDSTSGSVCVLPNSPEPPTRISPGGEYNPNTLTLRVDNREPIRWPHRKPLLIENLDMQNSHLVVLTSDGKRIQSFRFKFSEYHDAKLCVYFDGYQGVQLGNRTNALWCKVKNRACWPDIAQGIVGDVPGGLPPEGTSAIDGILSSKPQLPRVATPTHIRVAQGVMQSFLITKVNPSYPPAAERQHVDGTVLLRVNIDKNGNV